MLEHKMDLDPSFYELQEQLNGMQKIQITQEIVANEEKEQKIEERQPKTAEEQKQKDITAKETHEIEKNFQNRYSFENWKETNSAKERLEQIEKSPYAKEQNIKDFGSIDKWLENVYNMAKKETPHQIVFDIELNDKTKILEANQKLANKLGYKDIYALEENETKPTIEQIRNAQEIAKEIKEFKQNKELNPQEKQELAENTIKNINKNERFKEYYGLDDELKANQKAQEEKIKEFQKEMDELDKQYGQGQYYKPNWTFGDDAKQTKQENSKEKQENPNKLSPEEEAIRKEYLEKRKELELKQEKEMKKLKNEEDNIKAKMNDTTIAITTCGDFEELIKNLKQLDAALIALNKNKEEQIKEEQRQREELINQALKDDPLMQKIVGGMLKEQKEKQEELKKEQEQMNLAKEQANYLSKKVDDMQQTNNPNAKKSFAEDIEKALKTIDETKELEKKKEKTPAEEQKIKEIKKLEEHYGKTIERARKELEKYKKEQVKQQEQNKKQEQTQGVTR